MYRCRQRQWREWDWSVGEEDSTSNTGHSSRSTRNRQQTSVRRAASMPDSKPGQPPTCPTGTLFSFHFHFISQNNMKNKRMLSVALDRKASGTNNCLYKCIHKHKTQSRKKHKQMSTCPTSIYVDN